MMIVPLRPLPSQTLSVVLGAQNTQLRVYQLSTGLYIDVYVNDALVIGGVACYSRNRIVRSAYLGFVGDLSFYDTQGNADPTFDGLGSRFQLAYLSEAELTTLGLAA